MKSEPKKTRSKPGPKGDPGEAREAIISAARTKFARNGFDATSLRQIASAADVDVALISYYFKNKLNLFVESLALPVNPFDLLTAELAKGTKDGARRILGTLLNVWDNPDTGAPMAAMLRSLSTHQEVLRAFIEEQMAAAVAEAIDGPDARLRATLFTSQMIGLQLQRYVLKVEPVASASHEELIDLVAPNLQRYLDGK